MLLCRLFGPRPEPENWRFVHMYVSLSMSVYTYVTACVRVCVCEFVFLHMPNIIARRVAHCLCVFASGSLRLYVCVCKYNKNCIATDTELRCVLFVVRTLFLVVVYSTQGCFSTKKKTKRNCKELGFCFSFPMKNTATL